MDDISDISEIASLRPIAIDQRPTPLAHDPGKERDHAAIGAGRVLPWPEDVEVPEANPVEPHCPGIDPDVMFARELGGGVGAERVRDHSLVLGKVQGVAIGATGGGEHESADAGLSGGFEEVEGRGRPAGMGLERLDDRPRNAGDGRLVEHNGHAFGRGPAGLEVGQVPLDPLEAPSEMVEVRQVSGRQVVDHPNRTPLAQQGLDQMRADEPGASGHQDPPVRSFRRHPPPFQFSRMPILQAQVYRSRLAVSNGSENADALARSLPLSTAREKTAAICDTWDGQRGREPLH